VHAIVLSVFGAVKLSERELSIQKAGAAVSISQVRQLSNTPMVMPKPKVSPPERGRPFGSAQGRIIARTNETAPKAGTRQIFDIPRQDVQQQIGPPEQPVPIETPAVAGTEILPAQAEFFGSAVQGRRICYVVDCSGSMQGLWQSVREELIDSIKQLQPDQYFCVIAFGAGSVLESGGGKMVRATEQAKKDACGFIDSLRPAGTTNALAAMQQAVKIRDDMGVAPSLVYFLTDGFELSEQDSSRFAHQVMTMLRSFSPKTRINTIGFWPEQQDRKLLEAMARESGGEFVVVGDGGT
jgi:hypothetical protein